MRSCIAIRARVCCPRLPQRTNTQHFSPPGASFPATAFCFLLLRESHLFAIITFKRVKSEKLTQRRGEPQARDVQIFAIVLSHKKQQATSNKKKSGMRHMMRNMIAYVGITRHHHAARPRPTCSNLPTHAPRQRRMPRNMAAMLFLNRS